ncbi:hypothetical protein P1J78_12515 [Psychromarinibacter sp. C21-152]|uniref:Uncharacterized protein n=1 Tax=Psychromarinibacter sediminicola TaxID=3033385 RepID=A0AAE3NV65_9RHOB|nr:hypothetical protein [Psychromarinibacter sediminicola]MDF0601560.1 hypothetical protein [Psychromarinibacter sediminicola]
MSPKDHGPKAELLALIPRVQPLPGEDGAQLEALRKAIMAQLEPTLPLQVALVERIVECHWDHFRSLTLTRDLEIANRRKAVLGLLSSNGTTVVPEQEHLGLAEAAVSENSAARKSAMITLEVKYRISESDIRAQAYLDHMTAMEAMERRPMRNDQRLRDLMKYYWDLKQADTLDQVPDAEVM